MTRRTLLIDADIVAFAYSSANEKKFFFDGADNAPAVHADFEAAKDGARAEITRLQKLLKAHEVIICLSDPEDNFRKRVWSGYKSHRDYANRPVYLQPLKDWFKEEYKTYQRPGLEADDCMGILSTHPTLIPGEKVIVSADKDMQTIPGFLFNPNKDKKVRKISRLQADRFHLWQTIVGDATDGYPGARRVGPKSEEAQAVLTAQSVSDGWVHVLKAFERSKPKGDDLTDPAEQAVRMARLARILRSSDWDFQKRRPLLWTAPAGW